MARNKVIAGDYEGYNVKAGWGGFSFTPSLFSQHNNRVEINRNTVRGLIKKLSEISTKKISIAEPTS